MYDLLARGQFLGPDRAAGFEDLPGHGVRRIRRQLRASPPTRRLGVAADLLVAQGGTAILGETTEIYGAEHLLTRRAVSREVGQKLVDRIKWWEWYTGVFGARDRQ